MLLKWNPVHKWVQIKVFSCSSTINVLDCYYMSVFGITIPLFTTVDCDKNTNFKSNLKRSVITDNKWVQLLPILLPDWVQQVTQVNGCNGIFVVDYNT